MIIFAVGTESWSRFRIRIWIQDLIQSGSAALPLMQKDFCTRQGYNTNTNTMPQNFLSLSHHHQNEKFQINMFKIGHKQGVPNASTCLVEDTEDPRMNRRPGQWRRRGCHPPASCPGGGYRRLQLKTQGHYRYCPARWIKPKVGSFDRSLLKEGSRRLFRKIRPSSILWEPFKDSASSYTVISH